MLRRQASPARSPPGFLREKYTAGMPQAVRPAAGSPSSSIRTPLHSSFLCPGVFCPPIGLPPKGRPFLRGPFFSAGSNSLIGPLCTALRPLCRAGPAPRMTPERGPAPVAVARKEDPSSVTASAAPPSPPRGKALDWGHGSAAPPFPRGTTLVEVSQSHPCGMPSVFA